MGISVAVTVTDGIPDFELSIACEVFGMDRRDLADPWYDFRLCAADPGSTRTQNGFVPDTPYGLDGLKGADTVIVPALCNGYPLEGEGPDERLVQALRAAHAAGSRIVSLCTGAFALAEAGLLDGRRATTHWLYADTLAEWHPAVKVEADVLYVDDGDIMTSAGRSAGLDLCLHLVREDHGARVANQLARRMVAPPHRSGGQAQFVEAPIPQRQDDLLEWASQHLDERLTIASMARHAGLSSRTLIRRFHETTGMTPMRWLHTQRLALVRELLECTDLSVEQIARRAGMGNAPNLRHHFVRATGVTPTDYRRTFKQ
ncbi:helix-turn-helix domain-containing protein [Actinomadura barringtoniae]|uniref:Helix-turn-helix domain-containing protein n=1 Tax=Actinomadura barringtoniae TaxID=1427535 RepID=A0A939T8J9_9ACTN|nr:helix-turn-helix domain-containing protein [Actinomadura barringtoniae]MBO2450412.1 helix-turn-helix domain-containing protein [Actinomadura barringtoniae]